MKCTLETSAAKNAMIFNYHERNKKNDVNVKPSVDFSLDQFLRISFYEQRIEALNAATHNELLFEMRYADAYEDNAIVCNTQCYDKDVQIIINFFEEENDFAKHELQLGIYDEQGFCTFEEIDLALLFDAAKLIKEIDRLFDKHESDNYDSKEL